MKHVERSELLGLGPYEEVRDHFRRRVVAEKRARRVHLGSNMTLVFENHDTVLFQIQEMIRTERITKEPAIQHELETYNELIPGENELSATIFVEYVEPAERDEMLAKLAGLEGSFYASVDGERFAWCNEARGTRDDRTTAVHYAKLPLSPEAALAIREGRAEVVLGVSHPAYQAEQPLGPETLAALRADLA